MTGAEAQEAHNGRLSNGKEVVAREETNRDGGGSPGGLNRQILLNAVSNWNKGFLLGYSIETLPSLLALIIKLLVAKFSKDGKTKNLPSITSVLLPMKSVPLALFFASFSASYTLLRPALSRLVSKLAAKYKYKPKPKDAALNLTTPTQQPTLEIAAPSERPVKGKDQDKIHPLATFIAGTLAGGAIMLDFERHGKERRVTLALYLFIRAAEVAYYSGIKRGWLPSFYHGDTALFTISCLEIMYSWFYTPETLPPSYVKWISRMADMDSRLLDYLRAKREGRISLGEPTDILTQYCTDNGLLPDTADLAKGFINCVVVHPHDGTHCSHHSYRRFRNGFLQSLLIYVPVHFLPLIFWRYNALFKNPTQQLLKTSIASARSAAFLGAFISSIWTCVCIVRNFAKDDTIYGPMLGSMVCGLSLLIEKKSRRLELALYCVPRAIFSYYYKASQKGHLPVIPHFETALFALSSGAFLYFFEHEADLMKPTFVSFLSWLLKN